MACQLTVLMAVHNGGPYLRPAIDSILQQTYRDFQFLIIDDASTDNSREIVRSYEDIRIELVCLEHNVGQTAALNIGLRRVTTPWIARMDADDYSAPTRMEEQMQALADDPSLSCVGTHAWTFRDDPGVVERVIATPSHHEDIVRMLLRGTPIVHGSIMVSKAALLDVGAYDDRYRIVADVELYDRLLPKYTTANVPRQLLGIRQHSGQDSRSRRVYDESIEHCQGRLATNNYSREEAAIVRATLARTYVSRARFWAGEHNYVELWKDLSRAIRVSPNSFPRQVFRTFIVGLIPDRNRAQLRRMLTRRAPGVARRL